MKVLAVIPAYNEGKKIGTVVEDTLKYCDVLVVDDGSIDNTGNIAERQGASVVRHAQNKGKGDALITGFTYALEHGYDAVITLDADGQHHPAAIPKFLEKAEESYGIVIGARDFEKMPPLREISNKLTTLLLSWRTHQPIGDSQSGYRLIKTEVLEGIEFTTRGFTLESELLVRADCKIGHVPIETIYAGEKSHIKNVSDTIKFIKFLIESYYDGN